MDVIMELAKLVGNAENESLDPVLEQAHSWLKELCKKAHTGLAVVLPFVNNDNVKEILEQDLAEAAAAEEEQPEDSAAEENMKIEEAVRYAAQFFYSWTDMTSALEGDTQKELNLVNELKQRLQVLLTAGDLKQNKDKKFNRELLGSWADLWVKHNNICMEPMSAGSLTPEMISSLTSLRSMTLSAPICMFVQRCLGVMEKERDESILPCALYTRRTLPENCETILDTANAWQQAKSFLAKVEAGEHVTVTTAINVYRTAKDGLKSLTETGAEKVTTVLNEVNDKK